MKKNLRIKYFKKLGTKTKDGRYFLELENYNYTLTPSLKIEVYNKKWYTVNHYPAKYCIAFNELIKYFLIFENKKQMQRELPVATAQPKKVSKI